MEEKPLYGNKPFGHIKPKDKIYFDNASTTEVLTNVADIMRNIMLYDYGNASSSHSLGERAARIVKEAKDEISAVLSVSSSEITFTSGGTEANNLAILGGTYIKRRKGMHCITTGIEHPSVLNTFKRLSAEGWEISFVPVDINGVIKINKLEQLLRKETSLVSIMHINNEIGSIQPIKEVGSILSKHANRPLFHVDTVQSFCRYPVKPLEWGAHMISMSAHKIHASKGIGALYIKKGLKLKPLFSGGDQEFGLRPGTENVPGIAGMAEAVRCLKKEFERSTSHLLRLKAMFFNGLKQAVPAVSLIGPSLTEGAGHILSISVPGIPAQVLQRGLSVWHGVHVGIGSACSSKKKDVSHVLNEIGIDPKLASSVIRVSFSYLNTAEQIMSAISAFKDCYNRLLR